MDDPTLAPWSNRIPRLFRGISFQLMALLSLALLPVGAISVSFSLSKAREAQLLQDVGLLLQTKEIAAGRLDAVSKGATGVPLRLTLPTVPPLLAGHTVGGAVLGEVVVLTNSGAVLASTGLSNGIAARLPEMSKVNSLLTGPDGVFDGMDAAGKAARFTKVTLESGAIAAIGIVPPISTFSGASATLIKALFLPLLVWMASLLTAFYAARRLVIGPIQSLQREMRRFALGQRNPPLDIPPGAALEIQDVISTFGKLAQIVARNESALATTAEGKLLVLREVHHRIKNNLQMISSIISIQRRKTTKEDVRLVLRNLQDRVLSIAAVDQSLYQNGDIWDVRADVLIATITDRLVGVNLEPGHSIKIVTEYDQVTLNADQIGPLSLLANEAVTNALKYVGKTTDGRAFVDVRLAWRDDLVAFTIVNTVGPEWRHLDETHEGSGLGTSLIRAFCSQLAANSQSGANLSDQTFTLSIQFRPSGLSNQNPPFFMAG